MDQKSADASPESPETQPNNIVVHSRYGVRMAHAQHTGRKLSWHYTSYTILFFLLILTGATLLFAGQAAKADQQIQGDINLSGEVSGPSPSTAATITKPYDGQHFSTNTIEVAGNCTDNLLIEIYRNDVFAGSVYCSGQDTFSLNITIIPGQNILKAKIRDGGGQYGPDSSIVTVFYDVPKVAPGGTAQNTTPTARPFLIYTEPVQRGIRNGQTLTLKYELNGGKAPYAIAINWGDDTKVDAVVQTDEGDFTATHDYKKSGQFTVSISGSDAAHNQAFIQTTTVIQGPAKAAAVVATACTNPDGSISNYCALSNQLQRLVNAVWPAFIVACLMTLSFWLGERLIYRRLNRFENASS